MATFDVVIGANFGDEGKGLFTDYLTAKYNEDTLVVRFNGGAQAGHTVISPTGQRHVFSHFGAGSIAGASTFLSEFFISNPVLFKKELELIGKELKVYVHPKSLITTPYDMIVNQFLERKRNNNRHGSCGSGINETMQRNKVVPFLVKDINEKNIVDKIYDIRKYCRLKAQILELSPEAMDIMDNPIVIKQFIEDMVFFMDNVSVNEGYDRDVWNHKHIVLEGAQGLLLDQNHSYFPYVTHSKTGMANVVKVIHEFPNFSKQNLNVYYITRGYMTRHGAGPFNSEFKEDEHIPTIYDKTNVFNEWQQNLRYGHLDITLLEESIKSDYIKDYGTLNVVVTCMDQLPDTFPIMEDGYTILTTKEELYNKLQGTYGNVYISEGETRKTIRKF